MELRGQHTTHENDLIDFNQSFPLQTTCLIGGLIMNLLQNILLFRLMETLLALVMELVRK